eukprot:COSAG02_NODE_70996_length_192_cov_3198.591398_1_plen_37_part_10
MLQSPPHLDRYVIRDPRFRIGFGRTALPAPWTVGAME